MEGVSDLQILQYVKPKGLEEAYTLLTKNKNNQIIAGMMWLKMQERSIPTGIDLSEIINADSYDAKVNRNVNVTGLDGVNLVVNADTDKNGEKTEN